jgi:phosphatidylglycerophosphatase A
MIRARMSSSPGASALERALDLPARALATGFGSGYSPLAPGTAGSAVGLLLFWPLSYASLATQVGTSVIVFLGGVLAAGHVARRSGVEDPGLVVVDEVLGMWVSLLGLPFHPAVVIAGFLAFRVLDIVKPYPAAELEHLEGGLGIMADDVAAGLYANLLLRVGLLVWPLP